MRRRLTKEAEERIAAFERNWGNRCCTCFISPPCGWCTDPDNPHNVHEDDASWEEEPKPIDYLGAARALVLKEQS